MLTKRQFLEQLKRLVEFRTLAGDVKENSAALDYLETLISPSAQIKRIKNGGAEILLAGTTTNMQPHFGYLVHVDVVAGGDELFRMKQKDGRVFGRGVSDMKYSIPLGVALLNELLESQSDEGFVMAVTPDEELGGYDGAKFLAEKLKWQPQVLIVPDGGDNMNFVDKSKGIVQFEVVSKGKAAHASRPWQGKNSLLPLAKLMTELDKKYGRNNEKENWGVTVNFGLLEGGVSTNQVCDRAVLRIDYRFPETMTMEGLEAELRDLVASISPDMTISRLSSGLPTFTDVTNPEVKRFLKVLGKHYGKTIKVKPAYGASDARHFSSYGMLVLMIKPMGGEIHSDKEWLDVESALVFYEALREYLGL